MPDSKPPRMNIQLDSEILSVLDHLAADVRDAIRAGAIERRGRGKKYGSSNVAATIIERVVQEHPELLKEFFGDDSADAARGKDSARPK